MFFRNLTFFRFPRAVSDALLAGVGSFDHALEQAFKLSKAEG